MLETKNKFSLLKFLDLEIKKCQRLRGWLTKKRKSESAYLRSENGAHNTEENELRPMRESIYSIFMDREGNHQEPSGTYQNLMFSRHIYLL